MNTTTDYKYKAFISYSHVADQKLATALQSALQSFARPYYLSKSMLVFRDKTELSANPALWPTIQKALSESEYFILLASPLAARSRWVKREIDYWLRIHNNSIDNLLIVWTDGVLPWNSETGVIDWKGVTALPADLDWNHNGGGTTVRLADILNEEPLYLDFREIKNATDLSLRDTKFLDQIATLSATLQKRRKSELIGEDASRLRRYRRIRTGAIVLLSVLLIAATGLAFVALQQSNRAQASLASEREARKQEQAALKAEQVALQQAQDRTKEAVEARDRANTANQKAQEALRNETIAKGQAEERRIQAERQTEIALSRQLTAQAQSLRSQRSDSLPLSMLLAVESMKRSPSLEDDQLLRSGLSLLPAPLKRIPLEAGSTIRVIARHPNKNILATASVYKTGSKDESKSRLQLWDLETARSTREVNIDGSIEALVFTADGNRLLALSSTDRLTVWDETGSAKDFDLRKFVPGGLGENAIKISPDGRFIALRYSNHGAQVLSVDNMKPVRPPLWHPDSVIVMAFSGDGSALATASASDVWLWDLNSNKAHTVIKHESQVRALAFSHDARMIAVGCEDRAVVWRAKDPTSGRVIEQGQLVYKLAFSADGNYLATATMRGGVQVWDAREWRLRSRMTHRGDLLDLSFNPNNRELHSIDENHVIRVWDIDRNDRELARVAQIQGVNGFTYSLNGESLITAGADNHVTVWRSSAHQEAAEFTRGVMVRSLGFSPSGRYLATSGVDSNLRLWGMPEGTELKQVRLGHDSDDVIFSSDNRLLASFIRPQIQIFSVPDLKLERTIRHEEGIREIAFIDRGRYIVGASAKTEILIWDVVTGGIFKRWNLGEEIQTFAVSSDEKYLAASGKNGIVKVWGVKGGEAIVAREAGAPVSTLRFSRTHRYIGIASADKKAQVYDLVQRKMITRIDLAAVAHDICFSPDERIFAVASYDATARVYRTNGGQPVTSLQHIRAVQSIAFSANGKLLATKVFSRRDPRETRLLQMIWWGPQNDALLTAATLGDEDDALRIWSTDSWKEVARLAHDSDVTQFAFSPDSRYVATGNQEGARVFYLSPDDLIEASSKRLTQNLSEKQWKDYLAPYPYKRTFPELPVPQK